jgi:hypothetical protein
VSAQLREFIDHARSRGMDHQTIRMLLLGAGWKERDVAQALTAQGLDLPVPLPPDRGGARDAFLHLLAFSALYASVISLSALLFLFVNYLLPDPAAGERAEFMLDAIRGPVRWCVAVLLVALPLALGVSRLLVREARATPDRLGSAVRRWLTYLTLFVTAVALLSDVVTLLYRLLEGQLTLRFVLKVAIVGVLAGLPFLYYFRALRMSPEEYARSGLHRATGWAALAMVAGGVSVGFYLMGSPAEGRLRLLDERRVEDLRAIRAEALAIARGEAPWRGGRLARLPNPLPGSLEEIAARATRERVRTLDPDSGEPYEYRKLDEHRFELCATFARPRHEQYEVFWDHPAGLHCFRTDALGDPER